MNFDRLQEALYKHGVATISRIRSQRPNDTFYGFAFYTSGEFSYAFLTAFSYEGLDEVVSDYRQQSHYAGQPIEQLRMNLKWSPCDSPLHGLCEEYCGELDEIMSEVSDAFPDVDDEDAFSDFVNGVEEAFIGALQRMDSEQRFGSDLERTGIVLNLLMGDQSDEDRIRLATRVNPPAVVDGFTSELDSVTYD